MLFTLALKSKQCGRFDALAPFLKLLTGAFKRADIIKTGAE